jgi:hypothetical protein
VACGEHGRTESKGTSSYQQIQACKLNQNANCQLPTDTWHLAPGNRPLSIINGVRQLCSYALCSYALMLLCAFWPLTPEPRRRIQTFLRDIRHTKYERRTPPNKPNFRNAKMNLSYCVTTNYEQMTMNNPSKNKPNQTQTQAGPINTRPERSRRNQYSSIVSTDSADFTDKKGPQKGNSKCWIPDAQ